MNRILRIALTFSLVTAFLSASPATAQQDAGKGGEERHSEQGPVVNLPQSPMQSSFDSSAFKMASDPSSASSGSGGPLGSAFWGAVSDPKKDSERRVKKLIERLG